MPGRLGRAELESYWRACDKPRILLRGDSAWGTEAKVWLEEIGAEVAVWSQGTQLGLF